MNCHSPVSNKSTTTPVGPRTGRSRKSLRIVMFRQKQMQAAKGTVFGSAFAESPEADKDHSSDSGRQTATHQNSLNLLLAHFDGNREIAGRNSWPRKVIQRASTSSSCVSASKGSGVSSDMARRVTGMFKGPRGSENLSRIVPSADCGDTTIGSAETPRR